MKILLVGLLMLISCERKTQNLSWDGDPKVECNADDVVGPQPQYIAAPVQHYDSSGNWASNYLMYRALSGSNAPSRNVVREIHHYAPASHFSEPAKPVYPIAP